MNGNSLRPILMTLAIVGVVNAPVIAAVRNFDNSCGDSTWHACCGPDQGVKSNNWDVPQAPAPLCPILPNAADDIFIHSDCLIEAGKSGEALNLTQDTGTFTVDGALGIADLATFDGPFVWNSGVVARSGGASGQHIICNGGMTLQGPDLKTFSYFGGIRMTNTANAVWTGDGEWIIGMIPGGCCPSIFENAAGATFECANTARIRSIEYGVGVFENAGTVTKTSAGVSEWQVNMNNTGLVHVQNGELRLTRAGVLGGTWQIDPGAELGIAGNFFTLDPNVVLQGRCVVKMSGTNPGINVNDDVTIDDLTIASTGIVRGTGVLRIAGTLTNEGGQPNLHVHILPGGHLEETGIGHFYGKLDIEGTAHIPNGTTMGCFNQLMTISPGGVFTIDDGATLNQTALVTQPIENHGTIRKPPTGGTATIANFFNTRLFNRADGTVAVEGGTMQCMNILDNAGTFNIAAGAEFIQRSWANYRPGSTFTGEGFFHITAQNNFIDAGFDMEVTRFRMSGTVNGGIGLSGPGTLTVTEIADLKGGRFYTPKVTFGPNCVANVTGPDFTGGSETYDNFGRLNLVNQSIGFGTFNNKPGAIVDCQADFALVHWFSNGNFFNEGTLTKTGAAGNSDIVCTVTNTGTVRAASGTMTFTNPHNVLIQNAGLTELAGGSIRVSTMTLAGGILRGVGNLTANVNNTGGAVEPGASPGILNIASSANPAIAGSYTQAAGGRLVIEVGGLTPGTQHDRLVVAGTANLNGTLELKQFNGFLPQNGDQITVLTASAITGAAPGVVLIGFPGCVSANAQIVGNALRVTFGASGTDSDSDGTPDCIDGCPNDPNKVEPGVCGCGVVDADSDADGVFDCVDVCPNNESGVPVDADGRPVGDFNGNCTIDTKEATPPPGGQGSGTPTSLCGFSIMNSMAVSLCLLAGVKTMRPRRARRRIESY